MKIMLAVVLAAGMADGLPPARQDAGPRKDFQGDPLPDGALARLGTLRFQSERSIYVLAVLPDGKTLAAGGLGGTLTLRDLETGREIRRFPGVDQEIYSIAVSQDGRMIACGGNKGAVRWWDVTSGTEAGRWEDKGNAIYALVFSSDLKTLGVGSSNGGVRILETGTGTVLHPVCEGNWSPKMTCFSAKADVVATQDGDFGAGDYSIAIRELPGGKERCRISYVTTGNQPVLSPDGRRLIVAEDKAVHIWDSATGRELLTLKGRKPVAVSPDGTSISYLEDETRMTLADLATGRALRTMTVGAEVFRSSFTVDGRSLITGSGAGQIRTWDCATGAERGGLPRHDRWIDGVAFSPDGACVATVAESIRLWDAETGRHLRRLEGGWPAQFSPDGTLLAASGKKGGISLIDARSGEIVRAIPIADVYTTALAFSPDGRSIATAGGDGGVRMWDLEKGVETFKVSGWGPEGPDNLFREMDAIRSLRFSPDGRSLAAGAYRSRVVVWDARTGAERLVFQGNRDEETTCNLQRASVMECVAFSPDGRRLACGGQRKVVQLFEAGTGKALINLPTSCRSLLFGADGESLVTADGSIQLWEIATGRAIRSIVNPAGTLHGVSLSPDGRRLAAAGSEPWGLVWSLDPASWNAGGPRVDPAREWESLGNEDPAAAWPAIAALERAGAVTFLDNAFRERPEVPKEFDGRIARLDLEDFQDRQAAWEELKKMGPAAWLALHEAAARSGSFEVKAQVASLLLLLEQPVLRPPLALRRRRAIGILELIGTEAAREALGALAEKTPVAAEAALARAALGRMSRSRAK